MKLYKFVGDIGEADKSRYQELVFDNVKDNEEAVKLVDEYLKANSIHHWYTRINGPFEDGSYYYDYGSWTTFFVLTDKELKNNDDG